MHRGDIAIPWPDRLLSVAIAAGAVENSGDLRRHVRLRLDRIGLVDSGVLADQVVKAARSADRKLIEAVELFDLYQGNGVPEGKKSLAIAVTIQPRDRTLTDREIEEIAQKIVNAVTKATGGVLRS